MHSPSDLTVIDIQSETPDSVRVILEVPEGRRSDFEFEAGQHLPLTAEVGGRRLRRTYSLCGLPTDGVLSLGVRVQPHGRFSNYLRDELKVGTSISALPPAGRFVAGVDATRSRRVIALAAGSGITPILSICRAILEGEPESTVLLCYGNRTRQSTMFIDDLWALKNRFRERLQLHFLFSQEPQESPLGEGRIDEESIPKLIDAFSQDRLPDTAFVCGPDTMTASAQAALASLGVAPDSIHSERFGAPQRADSDSPGTDLGEPVPQQDEVSVTVLMDGHQQRFVMLDRQQTLVDAAADAGIELPYSCKGGVCATCRTHLQRGKVHMQANYGLEPWELEQGFVLACQSQPVSDEIVLDYDKA